MSVKPATTNEEMDNKKWGLCSILVKSINHALVDAMIYIEYTVSIALVDL